MSTGDDAGKGAGPAGSSAQGAEHGNPDGAAGDPSPAGAGGDPPEDGILGPDEGAEDGEDPRRAAHEMLGQAHAVLSIAADEDVLPLWCPVELRPSVRATQADLALAIGRLHAEIAGGGHDRTLRGNGIGGVPGKPKRISLRYVVKRLKGVVAGTGQRLRADRGLVVRPWLRAAAGTAKSVIGSIVEGTAYGHLLTEAFDLILNGLDTCDAIDATAPTG
jgi:hypothetical protein